MVATRGVVGGGNQEVMRALQYYKEPSWEASTVVENVRRLAVDFRRLKFLINVGDNRMPHALAT